MSGYFTRKMYDGCAIQQDVKQSTDPLELIMDVNKYVHCNNICKPASQYPPNSALLVDVESSLWGIDKTASRCDNAKYPFCGPQGCLLTEDSRISPHITPYACERGNEGENAVVTTNMKKHVDPGFRVPNHDICNNHGNGYYNHPPKPLAPVWPQAPAPRAPLAPSSQHTNFSTKVIIAIKQLLSDLNHKGQTPVCRELEIRTKNFLNDVIQLQQLRPNDLDKQLIERHQDFLENLSQSQQRTHCPHLSASVKNYFAKFRELLESLDQVC